MHDHLVSGQGGNLETELTRMPTVGRATCVKRHLIQILVYRRASHFRRTGRWIQHPMFRAITKDGSAMEGPRVRKIRRPTC